ncbi:MAG: NAD(P)H-binding protein [Chitinivorax sp.]
MPNIVKHVLLAGASGLTGGQLLQLLLADHDIERVTALVRTPLPVSHPKLQQQVIDFSTLEARRELVQADAVFCCLGTTMRQAGSQAHFKTVDYFYPLTLAMLAKMNGVKRFAAISSLGANADSGNFYLQVKGQLERALQALDFEQLVVVRPSLLLGERKQFRAAERLGIAAGKLVAPLLCGPLQRYRPIAAEAVAWNLLNAVVHDGPGRHTLESAQLAARYEQARCTH